MFRLSVKFAALVAIALPGLAGAVDVPPMPQPMDGAAPWRAALPVPRGEVPESGAGPICDIIAAEAARTGIPPAFLARLIWKESRFDVRAVSPKGAQGVAQFMPATAAIRGLADPFDPEQAIPASADYLAELRARFGNLGLAAAAYNSGENRVAGWLARGGSLPWETVDYVRSITFRPVEWFREEGREVEPRPLEEGTEFAEACRALPVIATRAFDSAGYQPWGVRVAGGRTYGAAARNFSRARRMYPTVLSGVQPMIVRVRRGPGGPFLAMVGAPSRAAARRLCARLRAVGGPCVVRRN